MMNKKRDLVVAFIKNQMNDTSDEMYERKHEKMHYGACEMRDLLDFLYEGEPTSDDENFDGFTK